MIPPLLWLYLDSDWVSCPFVTILSMIRPLSELHLDLECVSCPFVTILSMIRPSQASISIYGGFCVRS